MAKIRNFQYLEILACLTVQTKAEAPKKETDYNFLGVLTSKCIG